MKIRVFFVGFVHRFVSLVSATGPLINDQANASILSSVECVDINIQTIVLNIFVRSISNSTIWP